MPGKSTVIANKSLSLTVCDERKRRNRRSVIDRLTDKDSSRLAVFQFVLGPSLCVRLQPQPMSLLAFRVARQNTSSLGTAVDQGMDSLTTRSTHVG